MLEFASGVVLTFLSMVLVKSLAEPIAMATGKALLKRYAPQAFDRLDLEWLPEHYQEGLGSARNWLMGTVLPQELPQQDLEKIADYVLQNFDLKTSLMKQVR